MNGAEEQKIMAYALFSDRPAFTDDGNPHEFFTIWCENELSSSPSSLLAYLSSIDKV
jgi:hypothetical protein